MHTRISKPLWQLLIDDHPRSLRILTAEQRIELEKQMIADMKQLQPSIKPNWTCPVKVPDTYLIYAAKLSNARGLLPPSVECLRRGL